MVSNGFQPGFKWFRNYKEVGCRPNHQGYELNSYSHWDDPPQKFPKWPPRNLCDETGFKHTSLRLRIPAWLEIESQSSSKPVQGVHTP
jgi:hypothetical protein